MATPDRLVSAIADVLHRRDCLSPDVCNAVPSTDQNTTARAIINALQAAGYLPDDPDQARYDQITAQQFRARLEASERAMLDTTDPTPVQLAEYRSLVGIQNRAMRLYDPALPESD